MYRKITGAYLPTPTRMAQSEGCLPHLHGSSKTHLIFIHKPIHIMKIKYIYFIFFHTHMVIVYTLRQSERRPREDSTTRVPTKRYHLCHKQPLRIGYITLNIQGMWGHHFYYLFYFFYFFLFYPCHSIFNAFYDEENIRENR